MDGKESLLLNGWFETQLGQVIQLSKEKIHPSECPDTPYISLEHIESGSNRIKDHGMAQDVKSTKSVFNDGDILYGRLRPYLNKVFMPDFSGICSTDILVLKTTTAIDGRFLLKLLSQSSFVKYAHANSSGINLPRVNFKTISEHPIKLPPINEQQRIANKIEALQAKSQKAKQALETAKPLLEKLRQSILASAFRGDLTADWRKKNPDVEPASVLLERIRAERRKKWEENELAKMRAKGSEPKDDKWKSKYKEPEPVDIKRLPVLPDGWCWVALEELGIHKSGVAYKSKEFVSEGIQVVKLGNLYQGRFDLLRDPSFLPENHPDIEIGRIEPKDLLISQTGTRHKRDYGHFVIIPDSAPSLVLNQRVLCVNIVEIKLVNWVLYSSRLNLYQKHFFSHETGGVNQGNVGIEGVMRGPIPIAPLPEMLRIASILESTEKKIRKIEKRINLNFEELSYLNQSILSKAFQGGFVPQDPTEEPADKLLERIKTEHGV